MWSFGFSQKPNVQFAAPRTGPCAGAGAKAAAYTSQKWITSEETPGGRNLTLHNVSPSLATVLNNPTSIISIFGRARQGKSFLMNCLAGEREIFAISNKKDSCTQGIDISSKWLSLEEFSKIDSDSALKAAPAVRVGFVDAEGQGDKDVGYDAELVCPILLVSRCCIFNWKGDLQKDHLLQTLGIMSRAAKNVREDSGSSASGSCSSTAPPFGHLHIVFRDWQAVDTTEAEVLSDLFRPEGTAASRARDLIRAEVQAAFLSVRVWLIDAPASSEQLKTKLSLEATSAKFRSQIRQLRGALSQQMRGIGAGTGRYALTSSLAQQALFGKDLEPLLRSVVQSINAGAPIMPQSAYLNMLKDDASHLKTDTVQRLQDYTRLLVDDVRSKALHNDQALPALSITCALLPDSAALHHLHTTLQALLLSTAAGLAPSAAGAAMSPSHAATLLHTLLARLPPLTLPPQAQRLEALPPSADKV